jgi:hypothetical protein
MTARISVVARPLSARQGAFERAAALLDDSVACRRALDDRQGLAQSLVDRGLVAAWRSDVEQSACCYEESVRLSSHLGSKGILATALERMACLRAAMGRALQAAHLAGGAEALREALGSPLEPVGEADHAGTLLALREALGEAALAQAWAAGRAMPLPVLVTLALEDDGGAAGG